MSLDNTIEELLSQKTPVLYKAAHVSIRQLAEKLRTAMKDSSKGGKETKAMQFVFGIPFVKSLKLWTQAVSKSPALKPLIKPLVVVILSAIRAKESHMIFSPYVSILIGLINDIAKNCEVFIPIASSCLSTLTLCANRLSSKTLIAEGREPNISDVIRVSEKNLKDRRVIVSISQSLIRELARHIALVARTPALPEMGWPIVQSLRKTAKLNPVIKSLLSSLIAATDKSITEIKEKRKSLVDLSPESPMFVFEESDTSVGKHCLHAHSQHQAMEPRTPDEDIEAEDESDNSDEEEEEVVREGEKQRSKRSLKRQRQKEKKKRVMAETSQPDLLVEAAAKKVGALESYIVPFEVSSDEDE
jgi:nucleolar complex protein 2